MKREIKVSRRQLVTAVAATVVTSSSLISLATPRRAWAQGSAKYKLRLGLSIVSKTNERHLATGGYDFAKKVNELTGGEVEIQIIDSGQGCNENTCGDRVANGIFDIGISSAQNLGAALPYSIALDWPMLWGDRTEYLNFLFSPESNKLYRDVIAKNYGIIPLYGSGEMRSVMLGLKYRESSDVRSPAPLKGAKIRVTNSAMIAAFAKSMQMNPVPLAFSELLEGLRSGVVDATETWPAAATGFGMANVISQDLGFGFSPGFELMFISRRAYDKLPDPIKEAVLEAAYQTMISGFEGVASAQKNVVGNVDNADPESVYSKSHIRRIKLTEEELGNFVKLASVNSNEDIYKPVRAQLKSVAGFDVYEPLQDFRKKIAGRPLEPKRWWK